MDTKQGAALRPPHRSLAQPSGNAKHVRFGAGRIPTGLPAQLMTRDDVRIQSALLSMRRHRTLRQRVISFASWATYAVVVAVCFAMLFGGGVR